MPGVSPADLRHPIALRAPFTREGWIFELKHDGFRALVHRGKASVQLRSRTGRSMVESFPEIVYAIMRLSPMTLDGELVVPTAKGRSDFGELRGRNLLQRPRMIGEAAARTPAVLVVFDILELGGDDVRDKPLLERRRLLHRHVKVEQGIHIIQHVETHGEALFTAICSGDHEGIVAKQMDSPYQADRQSTWIKIKNRAYSRREAVVWHG